MYSTFFPALGLFAVANARAYNAPSTYSTTNASTSPASAECTVTEFSGIAKAVESCTNIMLRDIKAPTGSTIDLTGLQDGTTVTFAGTTTFEETADSDFDVITISGSGITITAEPNSTIDGNGQAYWDGLGSNGGRPKPNHFIVLKKVTGNSVVKNLHIVNWPVHLFSITSCSDLEIFDLLLDNSAGDAPNDVSDGLAAAHNSDGFDVSSSTNMKIYDCVVINQDDCVAITSGDNISVDGMFCDGGHGLSIGSVGGKSNNIVSHISFANSVVINSQNGARIKTNSGTTGSISDITYSNITVGNITNYGIDLQQDYLNGGPTGTPTNGVTVKNILFEGIYGTATEDAQNYYVLCGEGSCSNVTFTDVQITGGGIASTCNFPETGCPA